MKKEDKEKLEAAMASSRETQRQAVALLTSLGERVELDDWVTIKEYARRYELESTNVVSNWIRRGIIPAENIKDFPQFNGIRLIRAVPYMVHEPS